MSPPRTLGGLAFAALGCGGAMRSVDTFRIDQTEVTVAAYTKCVDGGACLAPDPTRCDVNTRERYPMNCVTWQEADTYCNWGQKRLPTEAEWLLAYQRNPTSLDRECLGDTFATSRCEVGSRAGPEDVGRPVDMLGSVREWTATKVQSDQTVKPNDFVSIGHVACGLPMMGSLKDIEQSKTFGLCLGQHNSAERSSNVGFRCVRSGSQ